MILSSCVHFLAHFCWMICFLRRSDEGEALLCAHRAGVLIRRRGHHDDVKCRVTLQRIRTDAPVCATTGYRQIHFAAVLTYAGPFF